MCPMSNIQQLVGAREALNLVFPSEASRPSFRTFKKWQAAGWIPFTKIGSRVFYDPAQVSAALDRRFKVNAIPA